MKAGYCPIVLGEPDPEVAPETTLVDLPLPSVHVTELGGGGLFHEIKVQAEGGSSIVIEIILKIIF